MVTPIQDWQAASEEEVTLPSGKVVRLRRPDLVDLLMGNGDIPDVLTNMIVDSINGGGRKEFEINKETLPQLIESINVIAKAVFVEPKLWNEIYADEAQGIIPIGWVSFADKTHVFAWAMGAQFQPAETFPAQQNGHLPVVSAKPGAEA